MVLIKTELTSFLAIVKFFMATRRLAAFLRPSNPRRPRDFRDHRIAHRFIGCGIGNEHRGCPVASIWQGHNTGVIGGASQAVHRSRTACFMRHPGSRRQQFPDTLATRGGFGQELKQQLTAGNGKPFALIECPKQCVQTLRCGPVSILGNFILAHFLLRDRHDDVRHTQTTQIADYRRRPVYQSQQDITDRAVTF